MQLSTLLEAIFPLTPSFDCEIQSLVQDSRAVRSGSLFLACLGTTQDGRKYIDEALARGARAILVEVAEQEAPFAEERQGVPIVHIPCLSACLSTLAARFYGNPSKKLRLIGVTGTNGKTSCSHFVAQALQAQQQACAVIGTLGNGYLGSLTETQMTTPGPLALQETLSDFLQQGAAFVSMEVSSHGLDQKRIEGLAFDVGIFTNLTQDHLDYHHSMAAYGAAKKRFFTDYPLKQAVINADDAFGRALIEMLPRDRVLAYSTRSAFAGVPSVFVEKAAFDLSGLQATIETPWGQLTIRAPLLGEFNLSNVLVVIATLGALGFSPEAILLSLAQLKPVPGRMQMLGGGSKPWVVVDYSHTPDSLEKALRALRRHCQGQLHCLFGCGGDRDRGKRPLMGAIAEQYADRVLLTSDNPRHENPEQIIAEIRQGLSQPQAVQTEINRSQAIRDIIQSAAPGDYVLIAGKGAEAYQQIGDERIAFSDVLRVEEVLAEF